MVYAILAALAAKGQDVWPNVDLQVKNATFMEVAAAIEHQVPVRFFFDEQQLDSLSVSIQTADRSLDEVLQQIFKGTAFQVIRMADDIFIIEGDPIQTELPAAYFGDAIQEVVGTQRISAMETAEIASLPNKMYTIGYASAGKDTVLLTGKVIDLTSGAFVTAARIGINETGETTMTDANGAFRLAIPKGYQTLYVNAAGITSANRQLLVNGDGKLIVGINEKMTVLSEVVVNAEPSSNVSSSLSGVETLGIRQIKQTPVVFGEADVLRVVLALPGVLSVGEASTGFNVRGGAADQNLVLFEGKTIYNPAHFFGFFSAINPDIVENLELYKGSIPSQFGGRLSSVLDIAAKRGNRERLKGSGGIGLLTSRLALDGPLGNERTTFVAGLRSTYSNWLLTLLPKADFGKSRASFYDIDMQIEHIRRNDDTLHFSAYFSEDRFKLNSDTLYHYNNEALQFRWIHRNSDRLRWAFSGTYSGYRFGVRDELPSATDYQLTYRLRQTEVKIGADYRLGPAHLLQFGVQVKYYALNPGRMTGYSTTSLVKAVSLPGEQALEHAVYLEDHFTVDDRFSIDYGVRYSMFNAMGPGTVKKYLPDAPMSEATLIEAQRKGSGAFMKTYHGPEIRVSARYKLSDNTAIKAGYHTLRQYIHMISNTATMAPTDNWKLSDFNIRPQRGRQASLGLYRNFYGDQVETYIEAYHRVIHDYLDYKGGARLTMNPDIERDVLATEGEAYGVELMVRKKGGRLNGWLAYTYSRILLTADSPFQTERVNGGNPYPANYDRPHDVTLVSNFRFTQRFSVSFNFNYGTGRPITLPIARYDMNGSGRVFYSERNAYRIPDYYRADLSMNIEGNHKLKKLAHSSWAVGVYNVTGRKNAYSTYFVSERGHINGYQLSIFGNPIPFVTYNFKF